MTWDEAWKGREVLNYGEQPLFVIGKRELMANKAATGRTKDKADWELLQHDVGQKEAMTSAAPKKISERWVSYWPSSEQPRERLMSEGAGKLSEAELLAIFLRVGCRE